MNLQEKVPGFRAWGAGLLGGSWVLITPLISLLITHLGDLGGLEVQL